MAFIRIAQAQVNMVVGDFPGNIEKIIQFITKAREQDADIVTFPELSVCGYPPEDLLLKGDFLADNLRAIEQIKEYTEKTVVLIGYADSIEKKTYSAAGLLHNNRLAATYHKIELPNYGVFDEKRYFSKGRHCFAFEMNQIHITPNICEDIWIQGGIPEQFARSAKVDIILNISASPFHAGKLQTRFEIVRRFAHNVGAYVCFNNLVGGQDELVFDGGSFVMDPKGKIISQAGRFQEELLITDIQVEVKHDEKRSQKITENGCKKELLHIELHSHTYKKPPHKSPPHDHGRLDEIYHALVLGTKDYVKKNGFQKAIIGLSGGIDSSLTSVIAVDALGHENVIGVTMPSHYTSRETLLDAERLARNLGIQLITIPFKKIYQSYINALQDVLGTKEHGVTHENIQARIRGNILMALSNQFGWLVLTTGNKSEVAVGYCTLYGDMAGGFAVIKDVPKTLVFELSKYVNKTLGRDVIPKSVLERPPSAELRPDQKDEDTLPPYSVLDGILHAYIVEDKAIDEIVDSGYEPDMVKAVIRMVDLNEYKRRQAPPGVKITPKAFGKDRRQPITNHYWKSSI